MGDPVGKISSTNPKTGAQAKVQPNPPTIDENITSYTCSEKSKFFTDADYLRLIEIRARGLASSAECQEAKPAFFKIPKTFPKGWRYSTQYVPVANELLFDSPFRNLIPTLPSAQAKALAEDQAESDRRHFWNMLVATIPQLEAQTSILTQCSTKKLKILDVGFGNGWDAMPLVSYFGGSDFNQSNPHIDYLGIDIDNIQSARRFHQQKGWNNLRFEYADATCLSEHFSDGQFDIVVIRHPEVFTRHSKFITETWLHIFKEAMLQLKQGGILLITAYRCAEYLAPDRVFKSYGAKRLFAGQNPFSANIELYGGVNSRDRFVAIYTKEGPDKIQEEDKRVRLLCGDKALTAKESKVQVSREKVTAQTPEGVRYEVRMEKGGRAIVYRDLKSNQEKWFNLAKGNLGRAQTIATDGIDTFLFVTGDKRAFYKINWKKSGLEVFSVGDRADFSYIGRGDFYIPDVYSRGFCIADGKLLGEAEIKAMGEKEGLIWHRHLKGNATQNFPITIHAGSPPPSFLSRMAKFLGF